MTPLMAIFGGSLLGSAHCIGMCGGFAVTIGATRRPMRAAVIRQLIYTCGRIFTYTFLGAVAGFAGLWLGQFESSLIGAQQIFSIVAGVVMLIVGCTAVGVIPKSRGRASVVGRIVAPIFAHLLNSSGNASYLAAGIATGFLPCGLVYAFLALAVASADVANGMLTMICFGLGTAPAMLLIGCGSSLLNQAARARIFRVAGVIMMLMGGVTIYRAIPHENACCQVQGAKSTRSHRGGAFGQASDAAGADDHHLQ